MNDFDITFFLMHNVFDEFSLNRIVNDNKIIDIATILQIISYQF